MKTNRAARRRIARELRKRPPIKTTMKVNPRVNFAVTIPAGYHFSAPNGFAFTTEHAIVVKPSRFWRWLSYVVPRLKRPITVIGRFTS